MCPTQFGEYFSTQIEYGAGSKSGNRPPRVRGAHRPETTPIGPEAPTITGYEYYGNL